MKDLVLHRRFSAAVSISAMALVWGIVVSPGGPWTGFVSVGALGILLVATAVVVMGRLAPASMAQVIRGVEVEAPALPVSARGEKPAR